MDKENKKTILAVAIGLAVVLGGYALANMDFVQDTWAGWWYDEPVEVAQARENIELTETGKRIFLATKPALETAENFNNHCRNQREDVSLLGCYTSGKMYVYDVPAGELEEVEEVTMAHELLHAVWARMNRREREEIGAMLEDYQAKNAEWAENELRYYDEKERLEELYTRVATKVRDLPVGLEGHYEKYFENRLKIVDYYENYRAPFEERQVKCLELKTKTDELSTEIERERAEYTGATERLTQAVDDFNECAATAGCFNSDESFQRERQKLEDENVRLQAEREELNDKIEIYNNMVREYEQYRLELGELSDMINSKVEKVEE